MIFERFLRGTKEKGNALLEATLLIKADRLDKRIRELASWEDNFEGKKAITKKEYNKMLDAIIFTIGRELKTKGGDVDG